MATTTILQHRTGISTGTGITMQRLRGIVQPTKLDIGVHLNNSRKVYSTADTIHGTARITAHVDTDFTEVEITFLGNSRTVVDSVTTTPALSGRSESFFPFLKMRMPGLRSYYPEDKVLRAGQTYEFPFSFVVPEHMPVGACTGHVKHESVRDAHTLLPPTLSDKDLQTADGMLDDLGCQMASIRYGIFVRILKSNPHAESEEATYATINSRVHKVRIIPGTDEAPPLDVSGTPDRNSLYKRDYELRSERKIRKGILGAHLGTLTIESEQPKEFRTLPPDSESESINRVTTKATVMLRYDPIKGSTAPPPRLEKLAAKLKCRTYYSTVSRGDFPKPSEDPNEPFKALNSESLELSSRAVNRVEWLRQDSTSASDQMPLSARRASASSDEVNPDDLNTWTPHPPEAYKEGEPFYLARLSVPIELPTTKFFVPTFHSCYISRVYTLALYLHLSQTGFGSMDLRVPVQICASRNSAQEPAAAARRRSSAALATVVPSMDFDAFADADDIASALFEPRSPLTQAGGDRRGAGMVAREAPPLYEDHMMDRGLDTVEARAMPVNPVR